MKQFVKYSIPSRSLAASYESDPIDLQAIYSPFIQINVSGASSLEGTFTIEGTADISVGTSEPTNWVKLTEFSDIDVTTDGVKYWFLPESMIPLPAVRIRYERTAGNGNATVAVAGVRL